jgi:nucleoside-diphosphate-sugar epimerase
LRVLIIGGTGFIGPHVVQHLLASGCEVAVFHRGETRSESSGPVRTYLGDRHKLAEHAKDLRAYAPQVVLDMIPITERDAKDLMHTFRDVALRVVAASSQDVYRAYGKLIGLESGPADAIPLTEDAPLRTRLFPYRGENPRASDDPRRWLDDYDKILVEREVMSDPRLPGTVLRLPMVYGPKDRQRRVFEYLKRMDDGRPAIVLGAGMAGWRWTRGYVGNVAAAIALAVVRDVAAGRIYNVGETSALSTFEWVQAIANAAGWTGRVTVVPDDRIPARIRPNINAEHHMVVDTSLIRRKLGYKEAVFRSEALQRTVAWERTNPPQQTDPAQFDYEAEDSVLHAWQDGA